MTIKGDAHSELMTAYPWGFAGLKPHASDNIADHGSFADQALQFTDDGALPGAPVRPYLNDGQVQVVPQVPPGQPSVEGTNIRLGSGSVDVLASRAGPTYTTTVDATHTPGSALVVGHTLPRGAHPTSVVLDGRPLKHYDARLTNRGLEVSAPAQPGARHTLTVTVA